MRLYICIWQKLRVFISQNNVIEFLVLTFGFSNCPFIERQQSEGPAFMPGPELKLCLPYTSQSQSFVPRRALKLQLPASWNL